MSNDKKTIQVFCASEQAETEHLLDITGSGEIILTCDSEIGTEEAPQKCGRFIKFAKGTGAEELKALIEKHKVANQGQVSAESIEAEKEKLLNELL